MKFASSLLGLCGFVVLTGCAGLGVVGAPVEHLRDVRIVRVVPAPWAFGITATIGKIEVESHSGQRDTVYRTDLTDDKLGLVPAVGEVCTIAYTWHEAEFDWFTGDDDASGRFEMVMPGQRIRMGESAVCGAKVYDFYATPEVDGGVDAEQ